MRPAAELLILESREIPDLVESATERQLTQPTVLDGWSVRDVVAHCGAALRRLVDGAPLDFTPEANQRDVDTRRSWPTDRVLAELRGAYEPAAAAIDAAGGAFDGLGLGEWVHGGDIREPLGGSTPYASAGIELVVPLLIARSIERAAPSTLVVVDERRIVFGIGDTKGSVRTDAETFVRLCAGRPADRDRYELDGVSANSLLLFG